MMTQQFTRVFYGSFLAICLFLAQCGRGMSTDPVPIIAPVAGLISVSSPNSQGISKIVGTPGAASGLAQVTIVNQTGSATVNATATSSGAFVAELTTVVGDSVVARQAVNGVDSEASDVKSVPANLPAITGSPVATASDGPDHLGFVAGVDADANRTTMAQVDLQGFINTGNFFLDNEIVMNGIVATDFAYDAVINEFYVIEQGANKVEVRDTTGFIRNMGPVPVTGPVSVAANSDYAIAVIGQESTDSVAFLDNGAAEPFIILNPAFSHPTSAATHVRTFSVSLDVHTGGNLYAAALSLFSDDHVILTLYNYNTETVLKQVDMGTGTTGRVQLFDDGRQALVTDTDSARAVHFRSLVTEFDSQASITVGDSPIGIALHEGSLTAFVANNGSDTVSVLKLAPDIVTSTFDVDDGIGLGPVELSAVVDSGNGIFAAIVANADGQTASLIDVQVEITTAPSD